MPGPVTTLNLSVVPSAHFDLSAPVFCFPVCVSNRSEEKANILAISHVLLPCIFSCDLVHFFLGRETDFQEVASFVASYARGISGGTFLTQVVF